MEKTFDDSLNLSDLKQQFTERVRLLIQVNGINNPIFISFLEEMKIQFCNDPDVHLVYDILNNLHVLQNYSHKRADKVDHFMSQLSIKNIKNERLLTKILNQIDVIKNYLTKQAIELYDKLRMEDEMNNGK
jgi:hypothetical protein